MSDVIRSQAELTRTLGELKTRQETLESSNRDLRENLDEKVEALTNAQRAVSEAMAAAHREEPTGDERTMRAYVAGQDDKRALQNRQAFRAGKASSEAVQLTRYVDQGVEHFGLLDDPAPESQWQARLQELVADRALVRNSMRDANPYTPGSDAAIRRHISTGPDYIQRVFEDSAGVGAEWIPDITLASLEREAMLPRVIQSLFQQTTVPPGGTIKNPFLSRGARPYLTGIPGSDDPAQLTASTPVTAEREWTAKNLSVRIVMDPNAAEDSIIAALPELRRELLEALTDGVEDGIINGDTAATHQDAIASWDIRDRWGTSGLGSSIDHRRAWVGLRARAFDVSNTADQTSVQTAAGFAALRGMLTSPHGFGGVVAITSPEYMLTKLLLLDEVETVDKFGAMATIKTGQLGSLYGVPIFMSEFMGADMNASGLYDNTTKTKSGLVMVNTDRFRYGVRKGAMVEVAKDITRQVVNLVATQRSIFYQIDSSTKKNVAYGYNLL